MEDRHILDAGVANKVVDSRIKQEVLCKLDLEKAYDHVNWSFYMPLCLKWDLGRSGGN